MSPSLASPYSCCAILSNESPDFANLVRSNVCNEPPGIFILLLTSETIPAAPAKIPAAAFIFESYDRLAEESAHGMGDHFAVLMDILEVEAGRDQVMTNVRQSMATVVTSADYAQMSQVNRAEAFYSSVMAAI